MSSSTLVDCIHSIEKENAVYECILTNLERICMIDTHNEYEFNKLSKTIHNHDKNKIINSVVTIINEILKQYTYINMFLSYMKFVEEDKAKNNTPINLQNLSDVEKRLYRILNRIRKLSDDVFWMLILDIKYT